MSQYADNPQKAFVADEAIAIHLRVKLDSDGRVTVAGLADRAIGVAVTPAFAAGETVTVRLFGKTHKMVAVEALNAGVLLYGEAAGKVQDTAQATAFPVGIALEAATADGDVIEVLEMPGHTAAS